MGFTTTPSGASCGATINGLKLHEPLSSDLIAELRAQWVEHKVLIFPKQQLAPSQLVAFSEQFGEIGEDPFFGHINEHPKVAAVQRDAQEKTAIFAEIFHSDWSFLGVPPAGTVLYGVTIPPMGGGNIVCGSGDGLPTIARRLERSGRGSRGDSLCSAWLCSRWRLW